MKIVVTGASGNVGTALLRSPRNGPELIGIARRRPPRGREPYDRARWIECDIGDPAAASLLPRVFAGADVVVHLAWAVHPQRTDPPLTRTNVAGTANVLRAVTEAGVRQVVCASSVAAYTPAARWRRPTHQSQRPPTRAPAAAAGAGPRAAGSARGTGGAPDGEGGEPLE
ncbi:NAD-dependent epimerase/dehydratase family protein [Nocardia fusca]|uniref:NAD-dependent epimerase/dehydratase family protein n=1 Tax=Nocardia fusca TaxID=941183 RepID=UPI0037C5F4C4